MRSAFTPLPDEKEGFPLPLPGQAVHIFADGSAHRGIEARFAFVVYTSEGAILHEELGRAGRFAGATNNVAEYVAVVKALRFLKAYGLTGIVHTDSLNVKRCVTGEWICRPGLLLPLCEEAKSLILATSARLEWIPRSMNRHADALAKPQAG